VATPRSKSNRSCRDVQGGPQKCGHRLTTVILSNLNRLLAVCWAGAQSARDNHNLDCNFACQIFTDFNFFSVTDSVIKLTTPPHLKYAATLPYKLSLIACFADINVSQGSVATYARCGGICNIHLTANLPRNLSAKKIKSVKI